MAIVTFPTLIDQRDATTEASWLWTWVADEDATPASIVCLLDHETLRIPTHKRDIFGISAHKRDVLDIPVQEPETLRC